MKKCPYCLEEIQFQQGMHIFYRPEGYFLTHGLDDDFIPAHF